MIKLTEWPREPLELHITVKTDDEVIQLREQVAGLKRAAAAAQEAYNHLEYLYRCECIVNMELVDQCRATGVSVRPSILKRRIDGEAPSP